MNQQFNIDRNFTVTISESTYKGTPDNYIEIEFDGGSGYYTQNGDARVEGEQLDQFLVACAELKSIRDKRITNEPIV